MRALLPLMVVDLLLFTGMGLAVLAWVPMPWRSRLLAGAPVLGAGALLVALHLTSLVVGVRIGTVICVVAAGASLLMRSARGRWWRVGRSSWTLLVVALLAGALSVTFVSKPLRAAGTTVVGSANDAFYYVSLSNWLLDHSALSVPVLGVDPAAYGSTRQTLRQGLRLGEEMDEGAVATVTGRDPITTWSAITLMWLFFIPGACIAACEILELHRSTGIVAGLLAAGSAVVAGQVLTQNSSALLGVAIAPVAIALWAVHFGRHDRRERMEDASAAGSVSTPPWQTPPMWLLALVLDGLVGAYTESLPVLGVGMALYAVLWRRGSLTRTTIGALELAGLAAVMGPLIWYDALRSLTVTATLVGASGTSGYSPFLGVLPLTALARLTGASPINATFSPLSLLAVGVLLGGWLLVGVALALMWSRARAILGCVLLNVVAVTVVLGSSVHYYPYGEYRAVGTGLSLVVIAAVAGWGAGLERLGRSAVRRTRVGLTLAAAGAGAAVYFSANQGTIAKQASEDWSMQTVSSDFGTSAAWSASVGGPRGRNVTALLPDYFTGLWSMYTLRRSTEINFPFLYSDYAGVSPLTYDDGRLRRYVLLGGDLFSQVDPAAVVGEDRRFRYLDVSRGSVVLAFGVENSYAIEYSPEHTVQQWLADDGRILVAHTPDVRAVAITLKANPVLGQVRVTIRADDGGAAQDYVVGQAGLTVTVPLGSSTVSLLEVHNHEPAAPPSPHDLRPLSVLIAAVRAA